MESLWGQIIIYQYLLHFHRKGFFLKLILKYYKELKRVKFKINSSPFWEINPKIVKYKIYVKLKIVHYLGHLFGHKYSSFYFNNVAKTLPLIVYLFLTLLSFFILKLLCNLLPNFDSCWSQIIFLKIHIHKETNGKFADF